ncbi:hypothetical protein B0H10DRAFT_2235699 [Mycena sp. CBHHK59/15]|nr:hypothetical protein B0H10DRAFT_2235699 [Mycena sp. CBHHK59/15]
MSVNFAAVHDMISNLLADIDASIDKQPRVSSQLSSAPIIVWTTLARVPRNPGVLDTKLTRQIFSPLRVRGRLRNASGSPRKRSQAGRTKGTGASDGHSMRKFRMDGNYCRKIFE